MNYQNIIAQEIIEGTYSRKHINTGIRKAILDNSQMLSKIKQGEANVNEYLQGTYYEGKQKRINQLLGIDVTELVIDIFVGVAYFQKPELFTSASSQIASRLGFSDRLQAITCTAELLAILCRSDAFDINKASKQASLFIVSCIPLPKELIKFIQRSQVLPPMVCTPLTLQHNFSSGYLTHNDSLILGSGNHHNGDLCLSVLDKISSVPLCINKAFLNGCTESPTFLLDTPEKQVQWREFKDQSQKFYSLMISQGNKFYLNHKVDKRGRVYASGYHINTQGTPYKKAILEFAKQELVHGVPNSCSHG